MKVYVSYKSYLWNFKGYEPPIATKTTSKFVELKTQELTEKSIEEIEKIITKQERDDYKKLTPYGSTEVIILGITKLDKEGKNDKDTN